MFSKTEEERFSSSLVVLSDGIDPLRDAFNRDVEKTRLLLLLSPT